MIPVYQDTENGCFRAAVASVLELNVIHVPDLHGIKEWRFEFEVWCRRHGYPCRFRFGDEKVRSGYYIAVGFGPRRNDRTHAVVHKGHHMVHDPHPSGLGIVTWIYSIELARPRP